MKWPALRLLKPAPYKELITDPNKINSEYRYWRIRICYSLFFGYAVFYFTRNSFKAAMPFIQADLGYTMAQLGLVCSVLTASYGVSKFFGGLASDRSNPRYFMAFGLIITGLLNIGIAFSSQYLFLIIFWALNGVFQAWGWPACCKSLTYWFEKSKRGLWYSVCSTSHNVGGGLIPIIIVLFAAQFGWRVAMIAPGVISIIMGFILINRLRDVPQSLGLPPVEHFYDKDPNFVNKEHDTEHQSLSIKDTLFNQVLNNKYVWIFSISYFFVYVVRTTIDTWGMMYLIKTRDFSHLLAASGVTWFEFGGLAGMVIAGWGSDYLFNGNRIPAMVLCALGLIISVIGLWYCPLNYPYLDLFLFALIVFFVFGPQMIVGLAAAEFVDKRAAAASNGFAGLLGYIGATFAGWPVGKVIDLWGWNGFYVCMIVSSFLIFALLIPLWSAHNNLPDTDSSKKISGSHSVTNKTSFGSV